MREKYFLFVTTGCVVNAALVTPPEGFVVKLISFGGTVILPTVVVLTKTHNATIRLGRASG